MNKVFVSIYVPTIEEKYDVWLPLNKSVYNTIQLLVKSVSEITKGEYRPTKMPMLYDKFTSEEYDINSCIIDTGIRNGTELIMI